MNIPSSQAMVKLKSDRLKNHNKMHVSWNLWDAYEHPFKASPINHRSAFSRKGVVWYLFTTFRYHFFQQRAEVYPKGPVTAGKCFHKEHLAFCKTLGSFMRAPPFPWHAPCSDGANPLHLDCGECFPFAWKTISFDLLSLLGILVLFQASWPDLRFSASFFCCEYSSVCFLYSLSFIVCMNIWWV